MLWTAGFDVTIALGQPHQGLLRLGLSPVDDDLDVAGLRDRSLVRLVLSRPRLQR
jgi:hypothetical protein